MLVRHNVHHYSSYSPKPHDVWLLEEIGGLVQLGQNMQTPHTQSRKGGRNVSPQPCRCEVTVTPTEHPPKNRNRNEIGNSIRIGLGGWHGDWL